MENILIYIKIITDWVEELQENYIKLDGSIEDVLEIRKMLKYDCEGWR